MKTSLWILFVLLFWSYLCSVSAKSGRSFRKNKKAVSKKVEELVSQVSDLQQKVQHIEQEIKESEDSNQTCSKNNKGQSCNEDVMDLEKMVLNFTEDLQQEKRHFGSKMSFVEETCRANLEQIRANVALLKENDLKLTEHTEDLAILNLTVNTKVSKLSDELEDIEHCLGTKCANQRAGSIKSSSFISQWFRMKAYDADTSKVVIEHGLNELPAKVDVQIKSTSEDENDWIFTGASVIQSDDDTGGEYGGVLYFYNETHIILSVPDVGNSKIRRGYVVNSGKGNNLFNGSHHYNYIEGFVRVKIWLQNDFPKPAYMSPWLQLDKTNPRLSFYALRHGLSEYPALVTVQVRSGNLVSEAMGSIMSPKVDKWSNEGGVLYGYDNKMVRVWTAYEKTDAYGSLFGTKDGWSYAPKKSDLGYFKVTVWAANSFSQDNFLTRESNALETEMHTLTVPAIDFDNDLVSFYVQALDGPNSGFLFRGWGTSQATSKPFGGAIYAYNKVGNFQVWRPDAEQQGYLVHIRSPYGNGQNNQASNSASYVVHLFLAQK